MILLYLNGCFERVTITVVVKDAVGRLFSVNNFALPN